MKKALGFYSPYSWAKYLRIGFAAVALIVVIAAYAELGDMGFFPALFFMIIFGGPAILLGLGIAMGIGAVIAAIQGKKRYEENKQELQAEGSEALIDLDRRRKKIQTAALLMKPLTWILRIVGVIIMVIGGLTINGESVGDGGFVAAAVIGVILVGVLSFYTDWKGKKYRRDFKELVARAVLESVLDSVDYRPNERFDDYTVKASGLFDSCDTYNGGDYLIAEYKGRRFTQSDLRLQEEYEARDSDGDTVTRYRDIFHGRLMMFDYDAVSNDPVFVHDKRVFKKPGTVETELYAFNERFRVVAQDAVAALRMLRPQVLEGIILAVDRIHHPVSLSFIQNKIFVAIHGLDSFEAETTGNANLTEQRRRVAGETQAILDMVENLYLK
jgi:hypothetical protein